MTVTSVSPTPTSARIRDAADLEVLLGIPYTDEQLTAITAPLQPVAIVAGAGSGKTAVMAARVVWLVGTGQVPPEGVLGLTFTNKAAGELRQRIRGALERAGVGAVREESEGGEPTVATYHSYAGRLVEEHGLRIGVEPHARLCADASRYQLAARAIRHAAGPFRTLTRPISMLVEDLLALDGELSEHLVHVEELRAYDRAFLDSTAGEASAGLRRARAAAEKRLELCALVTAYRAVKRDREVVDFGDHMALAARLAEESPEVGAGERGRYRVVLLDEYQDTSVAQRRMLAGLFGGGHPVTAVGDPCQAIYGWRGASVANLDDFPRHFPLPDGRPAPRLALEENRRSGETILAFANTLAQPLRDLHPGVRPLRPAPAARGVGEIRCALHSTYAEELAWVAAEVCRAVEEGTPLREIAVLVRVTRDIGPVHAELVARDIPVEVVGLGGLVHLPEVADLIAMLEVLEDPTANAALIRLLTGPRWRIGKRDLALLGRRAAELVRLVSGRGGATSATGDRDAGSRGFGPAPRDSDAGSHASGPAPTGPDAALAAAVSGIDPVEVVSLSDALAAPGSPPYSAEALERFAAIAAEVRELRRHLGEPLLDLIHRVITVTGLDVEIAASPHAIAARRRDSLSAFLDVAGGFQDVEEDTSVAAFLAYLRAAEEHERGLDSATPTPADSVKLLTAHKAKGLEWDVVVLPDLTASVFPSTRGRERWTTVGHVLPYPLRGDRDSLPSVTDWTPAGCTAFEEAVRRQTELEELRLGYVACTRPRRRLVASGHWWGPSQKKRRGPSPYLLALRAFCDSRGIPVGPWADQPEDGAVNPQLGMVQRIPWPAPLNPAALQLRRSAAAAVTAAMAGAGEDAPPASLGPDDAERVAQWDRDIELLLAELRRDEETERIVELPASLSATQLLKLSTDPAGLARSLVRPMPRPPAPSARRGTRFHAWVETLFAQQPLLEPDDLPGAADEDIVDDADLDALKTAFLRSPYASRRPYAVEAPFLLAVAGRVVRGRIDAVYETADGYEVVDWKTNRDATADPLQLAIYRLAWAEIAGVPVERVAAAFLYVRSGEVVRPGDLPGRADLERLLIS